MSTVSGDVPLKEVTRRVGVTGSGRDYEVSSSVGFPVEVCLIVKRVCRDPSPLYRVPPSVSTFYVHSDRNLNTLCNGTLGVCFGTPETHLDLGTHGVSSVIVVIYSKK